MLDPQQLDFIIQFIHPEKTCAGLPGMSANPEDNDKLVAPILGLDVPTYRRLKQAFADRARGAAQELLKDATIAQRVDLLPFGRGQTVVGLGDSITDDYQSWLEILRYMLEIRRPNDGIKFVNAGVSGDMSTQMMTRFLSVAQLNPHWIICFVGTNDARRHGISPPKPLITPAETELNLKALKAYATKQTTAKWVWITPAAAIQQKVSTHFFLGPMQLSWDDADMAAIASAMHRVGKASGDPVVDLRKAFGSPPDPKLLIEDGLHPSLEGQKVIVRALLERMVEGGGR
jgi:lysophospholipase L1-like esterase